MSVTKAMYDQLTNSCFIHTYNKCCMIEGEYILTFTLPKQVNEGSSSHGVDSPYHNYLLLTL